MAKGRKDSNNKNTNSTLDNRNDDTTSPKTEEGRESSRVDNDDTRSNY